MFYVFHEPFKVNFSASVDDEVVLCMLKKGSGVIVRGGVPWQVATLRCLRWIYWLPKETFCEHIICDSVSRHEVRGNQRERERRELRTFLAMEGLQRIV